MSVPADLTFLAVRNLVHDRVRFLITLGGISVAIVLIFMQGGMYLGYMSNASGMIDRSAADVWIVSKNSPNFDWSRPFPERYLNKVRSTPGVMAAKTLIFAWAFLKRLDGGTDQVEIIGFHPSETELGWGEPWGFIAGGIASVLGGDNIIIDDSAKERLGTLNLGDKVEIMETDVKIRGITHGIRSLSTAPYVFVSYETAQKLVSYIGDRNTVFILAKAEPGVSPQELRYRLSSRLTGVDVLTRDEYSARTRRYWTIQTGMGFGFLMMTLLSIGVGLTIVGQTIYAATMERLREYATLKALGATDREIRSILWVQAGVNAAIGYAVGVLIVWWSAGLVEKVGLAVVIPGYLYFWVFVLDIAMCLTASVVSVRKALSLDPAMVFRA